LFLVPKNQLGISWGVGDSCGRGPGRFTRHPPSLKGAAGFGGTRGGDGWARWLGGGRLPEGEGPGGGTSTTESVTAPPRGAKHGGGSGDKVDGTPVPGGQGGPGPIHPHRGGRGLNSHGGEPPPHHFRGDISMRAALFGEGTKRARKTNRVRARFLTSRVGKSRWGGRFWFAADRILPSGRAGGDLPGRGVAWGIFGRGGDR